MERTQMLSWVLLCLSVVLVAASACAPGTKNGAPTAEVLDLDVIGSYKTDGCAKDVFVSNSYAYVVVDSFRNESIHIIDVSNPEKPSLVSSYRAFPEPPCAVFVEGSYAYIADYMTGLQIIDVSDPKNPKLVSTYSTGQLVFDVFVKGSLAYLMDCEGHGLEIVDISEPRMPRQVSRYKTGVSVDSLSVSGRYAYLAGFIPRVLSDIRPAAMGVLIIDISEAENPTLAGFAVTGNPECTYAEGDYLYVGDAVSNLKVVDISNPAKPRLVTTCKLPAMVTGLFVQGKYLFASCSGVEESSGLLVMNISNPESPVIVGSYHHACTGDESVFVVDSYAYVAGSHGLTIIKVSPKQ